MANRFENGPQGDRLTLLMKYDSNVYAAPAVGDLVMMAATPENYEVALATNTAELLPLGQLKKLVKAASGAAHADGELDIEIFKFTQLVELIEDGSAAIGSAIECAGTNLVTVKTTGSIIENICIAQHPGPSGAAAGASGGIVHVLM
jgi:hypothetical protein